MNTPKFSILLFSSIFILSACSSQKITSQNIGNGIGTALIIGGIGSFPKKEDENTSSYDSDKKQSYGLIAGGIATYYLMSYLKKAKIKRDTEKAKKKRWEDNKCDSRAEKVKANKSILENHRVANKKHIQAINSCPRVITGKPKPFDACTDKESELLPTAICSNSIKKCKNTLKPRYVGKTISHICESRSLKFNTVSGKTDHAVSNAVISMYENIGKEAAEKGNIWTALAAGGVIGFTKIEKFENCTYEIKTQCKKNYKQWEKYNTKISSSCVSKKMGSLQSKLLQPNIASRMEKEEYEFKKLCK